MNSTVFAVFETQPADPWVKQMPLLSSPWPVTFLIAGYILFVLKLGRIFMEKRQPYNVKNAILVYNVFQVLYNVTMFSYGLIYIVMRPAYNLRCMETLPVDHPEKNVERWLTYAYFINKALDLLDTVFFVLRKSYKQITVLHVYHHVIMVYGMFWVVRVYGVGGQYTMMGFFNSFVHTVMYFYYFISAMYPGVKNSLWWKKYITGIQIAQFVLLFMQAILVLLFNPACGFPIWMQYFQLSQAITMMVMFGNFYYQAYIKPQRPKKE